MKIIRETTLTSFEFWGGACDNAEQLTYEELLNLDDMLDSDHPEGLSETAINDTFWFDFDYICALLGLEYDEENGNIIRDTLADPEDTEAGDDK